MCAVRKHDVDSPPSGPDDPIARSEALRRSGQPLAAERTVRSHLLQGGEGVRARAVLCLTLLDQGRHDEAYRELESAFDDLFEADEERLAMAGEEISALELDRAFETARPDTDQMIDANQLAEDALLEADLAVPEGFKTATMADLLEEQGDLDGAERIREAIAMELRQRPEERLAEVPERVEGAETDTRVRDGETLAVLERWLRKLRGKRA
ncbi:hypothetical protein MK489_10320 [Myxococcota bacterium]|nr:hypothetical protein [Myxococcota bacterium]